MTQPADISQAPSSTTLMLSRGWSRNSDRDRGYAGNQHLLTSADPATGAVKHPPCQQERATLPPQYGLSLHYYSRAQEVFDSLTWDLT